MHNVLMIVRREYIERVRKKTFWFGTLVVPLVMLSLFFGQLGLMSVKAVKQRRIAVVDETGRLGASLERALEDVRLPDGRPEILVERVEGGPETEATMATLERRVAEGSLFGALRIGNDLQRADNFRFYTRNVAERSATRQLADRLRDAVIDLRVERSGLAVEREAIDALTAPVRLETFQVSESGEVKKKGFLQSYIGTFAFVMLLYASLLLYGIAVMRGILEEKSNRVIEVLLASVTPGQLMSGKILGIGLVGLTQVSVYMITAGSIRAYVLSQRFSGTWTAIMDSFSLGRLAYFVLFFLLGYFLFTSLFAAVGAVCNSEQEAQNLQSPVILCLVIPMVTTFFFVTNPDSTAALVISLIPLFTPMVMFMRISVLTPPTWQIVASVLITLLTIVLLFRGVARVFRIGILMYGKRPSLAEILRWARSG